MRSAPAPGLAAPRPGRCIHRCWLRCRGCRRSRGGQGCRRSVGTASWARCGDTDPGKGVRLLTGRALGHRHGRVRCGYCEDGDRRCGGDRDRESPGKNESSCWKVQSRHRHALSSLLMVPSGNLLNAANQLETFSGFPADVRPECAGSYHLLAILPPTSSESWTKAELKWCVRTNSVRGLSSCCGTAVRARNRRLYGVTSPQEKRCAMRVTRSRTARLLAAAGALSAAIAVINAPIAVAQPDIGGNGGRGGGGGGGGHGR